MIRTLFLLSSLMLTESILASLQGNLTLTITQVCYDTAFTNDQDFLLCTHSGDKNLEIFKNNGSGFEFYQLLQFDSIPV